MDARRLFVRRESDVLAGKYPVGHFRRELTLKGDRSV